MTKGKIISAFAIIYSLINLELFFMFHIPANIIGKSSEWYDYFRYFFTDFCEFLMPVVAAAVLFTLLCGSKRSEILISASAFSLARFFYLFPYYYLYFTAYGNDWTESVTLSLLVTILGILINYLVTLVLYLVMLFVTGRSIRAELIASLPSSEIKSKQRYEELSHMAEAKIPDALSERGIFDLSLPITLGLFAASFCSFIYALLFEIYEVIAYIIEYGSFVPKDTVFTVVSFIFIVCELFLTHIIACLIKTLILKLKKQ